MKKADVMMRDVVEAVTGCRFEVTDPASEEAVLMKILQVLVACVKCKAGILLSDQNICVVVNTCFRVVHQAGTKGELLQRISRQSLGELVRCVFSHLGEVDPVEKRTDDCTLEVDGVDKDQAFAIKRAENGNGSLGSQTVSEDENVPVEAPNGTMPILKPYGMSCMIEIFQFLCSLLNAVDQIGMSPRASMIAFDEDVPLFALSLINSAIEMGGPSIRRHPELLSLIQDELFHNLMQYGLSMSPLILSMVCSIVLNLYYHLKTELKLQLEAFFSCVIVRLAQSRYGATYHQQEVAMEALVDFCRQKSFMAEMYANLDCDITCNNVFEDLASLLSKSVFPVNSPLSTLNVLALDGLIALIQGIVERIDKAPIHLDTVPTELNEYTPFWTVKCENYSDPHHWVNFVKQRKRIKKKLMIGTDHFNRDAKKGLEFLQGTHLLPEKLDPQSVACFFRYTSGLDKNLVGDFLGNHDEFWVQVLHEFVWTFNFESMSLDTALRLFLETFRLPGESQKIQRVLEAFSERYYEQSRHILANKDAALLLSYSIIMLNTDQHNVQVKKKMTEEDFIKNNRHINGGDDLPREFLSELYHTICQNEIRTIPEQGVGFPEMSHSRWMNLLQKAKSTSPYITCDSRPHLDNEMFAIISGPTVAALSVVFDNAEDEEVFSICVDGFLSVAKISAHYHMEDVFDDLVVSLCKFTTLLNSSYIDDQVTSFGDDLKARMATETVFTIANNYGDYIRTGWKNIVDCILRLNKLGLLPSRVANDVAGESEFSSNLVHPATLSSSLSLPHGRKPSGLIGRFSQFLYLDTEELMSQPTEEQISARKRSVDTVRKCQIDNIFSESKFLQSDSLVHLAKALTLAAGRPQKVINSSDEGSAVFCLELLIAITLNNRDRIGLLWQGVYDNIANIVQNTVMPCALVEKSVFGLIKICQRLLPYKENLAEELLRSLQLVLKLDARVADAYCENITQEVSRLVKANSNHIKSHTAWRTITSLLSISSRHPDASAAGFEALVFIMSEGSHLSPANYVLCIEAARQFADSRLGLTDRSVHSLNLMADSVSCLTRWFKEAQEAGKEAEKIQDGIREMWMRLVHALKKVSVDQREEVRNQAISSLQRCMVAADIMCMSSSYLLQFFDLIMFPVLDDLLEIAQNQSQKDYPNMEGTLLIVMKFLSKVFLQLLQELARSSDFNKIWLEVLSRMEKYIAVKVRGRRRSDKLQELIPELLRNILLVMKTSGILIKNTEGDNNLWEITWVHVKNIAPALQFELFPEQ